MGRGQKRLAATARGIPVGTSKEEALDEVFAFFMSCYHLRDWVIGSGLKTEADVDGYIRSNNDLALCRDMCTGLKHDRAEPSELSLTRPGRRRR